MARTPFKMRSGNSTPLKMMGSSPLQQGKVKAGTKIIEFAKKAIKGIKTTYQKHKGTYVYPEGKSPYGGYARRVDMEQAAARRKVSTGSNQNIL